MEKIFDIAKDKEQSWGTLATAIDGNFEEVNAEVSGIKNNFDITTIQSKNLFDGSVIQGYIKSSDYGFNEDASGKYIATAPIKVKPNFYYYIKRNVIIGNKYVRCLIDETDANGKSALNAINDNALGVVVDDKPFRIPSDCNYIQAQLVFGETPTTDDYLKLMIEEIGETYDSSFVPSDYVPFADKEYKIKSSALPKEIVAEPFKVLLIGSSFGVNTICHLPFMASSANIDIICGNTYIGGGSLQNYADVVKGVDIAKGMEAKIYADGAWKDINATISDPKILLDKALAFTNWDVIIIQPSADESQSWNSTKADNVETIIDYIKVNAPNSKIVYNSIFWKEAVNSTDKSAQVQATMNIVAHCRAMQNDFGIEWIPTCIAVQNARMTKLMGYGAGSADWSIPDLAETDHYHLDIGVGSYVTGACLFEYFFNSLYGKSVININYTPEESKIKVWSGFDYTQPSEEFMKIANYCAMASVRNPLEVNTAIAARYPYVAQ